MVFLVFVLNGCGKGVQPHPVGSYLLTKGQAVREIKLKYPDLVQFHECSKSPDLICSAKDIFIFGDSNSEDFYDVVFRDGSGRIYNKPLSSPVYYLSEYYYFTVTKTTGQVLKKGAFEKKFNLNGNYDFTCKGNAYWNIPVTTDCSKLSE